MEEKIEKKVGKDLYNDLSSIMDEEYEKRMLITPSYCANKMLEKGYRKESDTAREILNDIITGFVFGWKADNEDYRNGYCQALTDYDEKIKSYIKEKYGVGME